MEVAAWIGEPLGQRYVTPAGLEPQACPPGLVAVSVSSFPDRPFQAVEPFHGRRTRGLQLRHHLAGTHRCRRVRRGPGRRRFRVAGGRLTARPLKRFADRRPRPLKALNQIGDIKRRQCVIAVSDTLALGGRFPSGRHLGEPLQAPAQVLQYRAGIPLGLPCLHDCVQALTRQAHYAAVQRPATVGDLTERGLVVDPLQRQLAQASDRIVECRLRQHAGVRRPFQGKTPKTFFTRPARHVSDDLGIRAGLQRGLPVRHGQGVAPGQQLTVACPGAFPHRRLRVAIKGALEQRQVIQSSHRRGTDARIRIVLRQTGKRSALFLIRDIERDYRRAAHLRIPVRPAGPSKAFKQHAVSCIAASQRRPVIPRQPVRTHRPMLNMLSRS